MISLIPTHTPTLELQLLHPYTYPTLTPYPTSSNFLSITTNQSGGTKAMRIEAG